MKKLKNFKKKITKKIGKMKTILKSKTKKVFFNNMSNMNKIIKYRIHLNLIIKQTKI